MGVGVGVGVGLRVGLGWVEGMQVCACLSGACRLEGGEG